jgi:hypothetical protein
MVGTMGIATMATVAPANAQSTAQTTAPSTPSTPNARAIVEDVKRGLRFSGLRQGDANGRCRGMFEAGDVCTHGPDAAPAGIDVRARRGTPVMSQATSTGSASTAAAAGTVPCYGDGVSGDRVQTAYVHASDVPDRYSQFLSSFTAWASAVDTVFNSSAAETGGSRHVRFVTDSSCNLSVLDIQVSTTGDDNISNTIQELRSQGFNRSDRKYLLWVDANVYCGIGQVYGDDSSGQANLSNGASNVQGEVARVDNGCWGVNGQSIEAHELMHTMGGVQTSAPHATSYSHCWDQADRMCYDDGSGAVMRQICPSSHGNLFDCNHDDYYSTAPPAGSYLATHWNVANSAFLTAGAPSAAPLAPVSSWDGAGAPPGGMSTDPGVASWGAGRIDVVAGGSDNALWHTWYDGSWHPWESLGGSVSGNPDAVSWTAGRLDVFVRGGDGNVWHRWYAGSWSGWESLGAPPAGLTAGVQVSTWGPGRIDIVGRGGDGAVWHKWYAGGWSTWENLGGGITGNPSSTSWSPGRFDVFARGSDNNMWHRWYDNGWSGWENLGGPSGGLASAVSVANMGYPRLSAFVRGTDGALWQREFNGAWTPWTSLGGTVAGDPGATAEGGNYDIVVRGTDNQAWHRTAL